jgi:hypothetical protein
VINALTQDNIRLKTELEALKQNVGKAGGADAVLIEENKQLTSELEKLKNSASTGAASGIDATRMKELEAKLAEYEVIVEDLANLKEYKQENERLKKELEAMGGSTGSAGATSAGESPIPAEPIAVEAKEPDEVQAQTQAQEEPVTQAAEEVAAAAATVQTPEEDLKEPAQEATEATEAVQASETIPEISSKDQEEVKAEPVLGASEETIEKIADQVEEKISEKQVASPSQGAEEELSDQDKALLEEFEKMIGDDKNVNP